MGFEDRLGLLVIAEWNRRHIIKGTSGKTYIACAP